MTIDLIKTKYDTLDNRVEVAFTENTDQPDPFTIKVDRKGMSIYGRLHTPIESNEAYKCFAGFMAQAWNEHLKLKPRISLTPTDG